MYKLVNDWHLIWFVTPIESKGECGREAVQAVCMWRLYCGRFHLALVSRHLVAGGVPYAFFGITRANFVENFYFAARVALENRIFILMSPFCSYLSLAPACTE